MTMEVKASDLLAAALQGRLMRPSEAAVWQAAIRTEARYEAMQKAITAWVEAEAIPIAAATTAKRIHAKTTAARLLRNAYRNLTGKEPPA